MPKYKTNFQDIWLENEKYVSWLEKDIKGNSSLARCKVCSKTFSISSMGIKALYAHTNGTKHKERLPCKQSLFSAFKKKPENEHQQQNPSTSSASRQSDLSDMFQGEAVLKAEIIWCLDVVHSKYSFGSSENKSNQFACMFPDSKIAKDFSCGRTKYGYFITICLYH